jgi:hypothetical protein
MYYVNGEERAFCATDNPYIFLNNTCACYKDTLLYPKPPEEDFGQLLFKAALRGDITCMSYDARYKLLPEQVLNCLKETPDDPFQYEWVITNSDTTYVKKVNKVDLLEFDRYLVIEKTVRTRQFQINSKILAICPVGQYYDDKDNYMGIKMYNWFILP